MNVSGIVFPEGRINSAYIAVEDKFHALLSLNRACRGIESGYGNVSFDEEEGNWQLLLEPDWLGSGCKNGQDSRPGHYISKALESRLAVGEREPLEQCLAGGVAPVE
jgi:hypothetical protein